MNISKWKAFREKNINFKSIIILHIVLTLFSMLGIVSKTAAKEEFFSGKFLSLYGMVIIGLVLYAFIWQELLKKIPLVTAYANKSITVIWGIIWGHLFFNEPVTIRKILGSVVIIIGVCFVVYSDYAKNSEEESEI